MTRLKLWKRFIDRKGNKCTKETFIKLATQGNIGQGKWTDEDMKTFYLCGWNDADITGEKRFDEALAKYKEGK